MLTPQYLLPIAEEMIVDLFAGGGGASTGIEAAIGRHVDVAINHDRDAVSLHAVNHPQTRHHIADVFEVDPLEVTQGRPVGLLWASPDCFPAGTLVLTNHGYQAIESIAIGDQVLTHRGRWCRVTETSRSMRPILSIRGHGHPGLRVSPEHPFYVRTRPSAAAEWLPASGVGKGLYWATPSKFPKADVPPVSGRGMSITPSLLWLAGRYAGDGWTRLTDSRAELVITCGAKEAESLRQVLQTAWPRQGKRAKTNELAWHERTTRTAVQFSINHQGLVQWLREHFGHRAECKMIPSWALGIAPELREALLSGYLSADGSRTPTFYEATTVSKAMAFSVKALANSLGHTVAVYTGRNSEIIEGRKVNARPYWRLRWRHSVDKAHCQTFRHGHLEWTPVRERGEPEGVEEVFNIGVEEDESYVVEGIVVHNCKHFSKAKGGKPVNKKVRSLAWVVVKWAKLVRPRVILLENVEEFKTWGPLCEAGTPCPIRKGQTFDRWQTQLRNLGYTVEYRELRACDYGAPTIRKRLFLVARCDGLPITWPEPTHGPGRKSPWRTAAECIDWNQPVHSIFMDPVEARSLGLKRPLAEATMKRIAHGLQKYVIEAAEPFIVRMGKFSNITGEGSHFRGQRITKPMTTVTSVNDRAIVVPWTEKHADTSNSHDTPVDVPPRSEFSSLVSAFMAKHYGGVPQPGKTATPLTAPLSTVTASDHHSLIASNLLKLRNKCDGQDFREPIHTITTGEHFAEVRAFLVKYYGSQQDPRLEDPLHTVTTRDRFGLVTVNNEDYAITDIGIRMLTPRELYRAQGFPESYIINRGADGRAMSKSAQVRMCGNSVCPPIATALVRSNYQDRQAIGVAA